MASAVVQERYERLAALQDEISGQENARQVGRTVQVLVADGAGRKDDATHRVTGRAADNRLVHLATAPHAVPRPGDLVTVTVTRSAPHHLVADSALEGGTYEVRRTRAGDAWAARQAGEHEHGHGPATTGGPVVLPMPALRVRGQR